METALEGAATALEEVRALARRIDGTARPAALVTHVSQPPGRGHSAYRVEARAGRGVIYLYGAIGAGLFGGVSAKQFAADLAKLGAVGAIDLHINSDGGDVFEGKAMHALLSQHPARITVHVDGLAASIASLIAMAGDEILMAGGAFMMVHRAWGVAVGDDAEMARMSGLLATVSATLRDTYAARTGNDPSAVEKWMSAETWFAAEEAVAAGFADAIAEPVKIAAALRDGTVFRNLPAALR